MEANETSTIMTVIIPYTGNKTGLAALLVMLQPQLHPDSDIYIIDTSKDKSARQIVLQYGSTRCFIFVEPSEVLPEAKLIQKGLESMKQNNQEGALIIYPNCLISTTFILNLKKAAKHTDWNFIIPRTVKAVDGIIDPNFVWFSKPTVSVVAVEDMTDMPEEVPFYVPSREIDESLRMDMMRNLTVGMFENELVVVL